MGGSHRTDGIEIEAFFDCSCVWAYLAFEHLDRFRAKSGVQVRWRPVLAAEVFDQVNRAVHWPMSEVKQDYYRRDLAVWADFLGLELVGEPPDPAEMSSCMRACVAAARWDRLEAFARTAMEAAFAHGRDLGDRAVLAEIWRNAGLPEPVFEEAVVWPEIAAELAANARELAFRGGFGVPTFFVGHDMFFGNDALPLVERAISDRKRLAIELA